MEFRNRVMDHRTTVFVSSMLEKEFTAATLWYISADFTVGYGKYVIAKH